MISHGGQARVFGASSAVSTSVNDTGQVMTRCGRCGIDVIRQERSHTLCLDCQEVDPNLARTAYGYKRPGSGGGGVKAPTGECPRGHVKKGANLTGRGAGKACRLCNVVSSLARRHDLSFNNALYRYADTEDRERLAILADAMPNIGLEVM